MWKSLIVSLCIVGIAVAEQTPVFLWGANSDAKPSLRTVPEAEFQDQLTTLLKDHMVVAFEENGLTNKDFGCSDSKSQSCYAHLQGVSPKTYYTSVENPAAALRAAAAKREHNSVDSNGQLANRFNCTEGTAVFVTFDAVEEAREATLKTHDSVIAAINDQLECNVAYLYMAAPSTSSAVQSRKRRDTTTTAEPTYFFHQGNQLQFSYDTLLFNSQPLKFTTITVTNDTTTPTTKFAVTLAGDAAVKSLTFDITYTVDGYYNMQNVQYDGHSFRSVDVNAPTTFSYYCGNLTLTDISDTSNTLVWSSLQFQAPFSAKAANNFAYGDAWHCVGFVTPGILMGLFVVLILLIIVAVGVCWMMDINTMDRFDDPKGKTITINASAD